MTSKLVDPTVIPEVEQSPDLRRTTLVKRGGSWLMPECCESMNKREELGEEFFDDDAVAPSLTTFTATPEDLGFLHQDTRSLRTEERKNEVQQTQEEIITLLHRRRR